MGNLIPSLQRVRPSNPTAEIALLKSVQCGFESHLGHMKNYIGLKAVGMGFDAHLTVQYTGDLDAETELLVQVIVNSLGNPTFYVERRDIVMFGPNHDIPVLRIHPTFSLANLELKLRADLAIPRPSEFAWNPHISLKFEPGITLRIPPVILLNQLDLY